MPTNGLIITEVANGHVPGNGHVTSFAEEDRLDLLGNPLMTTREQDYAYEKFLKIMNPSGRLEKVGIAIFGLGRAGTVHLKSSLANHRIKIHYIVETQPKRREQMKTCLGLDDITFLGNEEEDRAFDDPAVQAVVIATPTFLHEDLVRRALKAGKAVFCEKPVANNLAEVEECYDMAAELNLPLFCAFNRRFDPSFLEVKNRVQSGEIGPIHVIKTCSRDAPLPSLDYLSTSKGIIKDMICHDLDMVTWVANEFPTKVYCDGRARRPDIAAIDDHDTVCIHLTFPSGALSLIDVSRHAVYGYDQRLEVFGPGGMITAKNVTCTGVEAYKRDVTESSPIQWSFPSRYEEGYAGELNHFLDIVQGKAKCSVTRVQIRSVYKIIAAAEESLKTGQAIEVDYN